MIRPKNISRKTGKLPLFLVLLVILAVPALGQPGGGFLYLSDQRIVTLEMIDDSRAVVNYLNLAESYTVFIPSDIIIFGADGQWKRAQVIKNEDLSDDSERFLASKLVRPGEVFGAEVQGDMEIAGDVTGACLRIDGRILLFEKLLKRDMDVAVSRISNLDLDRGNRKYAIQRAGFQRGFGRMFFEGSEEAAPYQDYFRDDPVFGPVAVSDPRPLLPRAFSSLPDPVTVTVSGTISRFGGLKDTSILKGLDPVLDDLALETVRGSWQFLPAVQGTEIAEAEVKLNVTFRRE